MIVVTVDLQSARHHSRNRRLATVLISNDGTGSATYGNYDVEVLGAKGRTSRRGRVVRYPRQQVAALNLVRRACEAAGYTK